VVFRPESFCKTDFSLLNPLECTEKDHHFHFPYNHFFVYVMMVRGYSLRPTKSVVIAFKFCPTKSVVLACNEIHLIKVIPSTKKALHRKAHRANQIFSRYSLRSTNNVVLAFKFCPTKSIVLVCNKIHLIKVIPSIKKTLYRKTHRANQILSRCYFSSSNAYTFIEDLENQINNTVFNHNC